MSEERLLRDEGESHRTVIVHFNVAYKTDAPADYDPDHAMMCLLDVAPQSFELLGRDTSYDMEAVGWDIRTEEWGDIGTGEQPPNAASVHNDTVGWNLQSAVLEVLAATPAIAGTDSATVAQWERFHKATHALWLATALGRPKIAAPSE